MLNWKTKHRKGDSTHCGRFNSGGRRKLGSRSSNQIKIKMASRGVEDGDARQPLKLSGSLASSPAGTGLGCMQGDKGVVTAFVCCDYLLVENH